jgi:hypothetical protein
MTHETHAIVFSILLASDGLPTWVRDQLAAAGALPSGCVVEDETIEADYLDFLREQIRLEPRGPAWTAVLRSRLDAFSDLVGEKLYRVEVVSDERRFVGRIHAKTRRLVHQETE